ncbi:MAG: NADH-quinone oxidoreductase subunit M [Gemmatimonadota bacterium]|nr:MAG: NADH-quinone oxidoreductase subunit M [Gemmatimonadota bacterium]
MSQLATLYSSHWIITFLVFFPAVAGLVCLFLPRERIRYWAFTAAMLEFLVSLPLFWTFKIGRVGWQNFVTEPWIPDWGISYALGVDGISLLLILLTTFLLPISVLVSWDQIKEKERAYYAMLLILVTGILGVFVALDLFLFYVFWEVTLIPMYFLIGVWGHERRIYAAVKFFLFTALGSLLMLVAILVLFWLHIDQFGVTSLGYADMLRVEVPGSLQYWLFAAFALAFAIKVPIFPFHTWLPDAHVEAPTAGSVILAAVLLKLGVYGFLRFAIPFFPSAALSQTVLMTMMALALMGIIYTAWVAAVQPNLKKLIAYTSVAHLGFIMVGTFALTSHSVTGGVLQMVNHGLSTGALFILAGFLYNRRHTYEISEYSGLAKVIPVYSGCLVLVALSSIGLPGLNGFVGEFLILIGSFGRHPWITLLATTGVIFAAYYMLPMIRRAVWNDLRHDENRQLLDLSRLELAIIVPLLIMIVLMGVYPKPFIDRIAASAESLSEEIVLIAGQDAQPQQRVVAGDFTGSRAGTQ